MLHLHIDPHSGVPVYRQVMDQIRYHLASGTLAIGDQLPSIRELAKAGGMTTLLQDGVEKVVDGLTDLKQVLAVCSR